jgi:aldehyde:ferredoxin oxidoreductase
MGMAPPDFPELDKYTYIGKGHFQTIFKNSTHMMNASGMCMFGSMAVPPDALPTFLSLVTGWELTAEELDKTGHRIATMRQVFNIREGLKPKDFKLQGLPIGVPPLEEGPVAGVTVDAETLSREYLEAMGWDVDTGKPSKEKLEELGLFDIAKEFWP